MKNPTLGLAKSAGVGLVSSVVDLFRGRGGRAIWGTAAAELTWSWRLSPACQQGFSKLMCRYSNNSLSCDTFVRVTTEIRSLRVPGQLLFALGVVSEAHQISKAIGRSLRSRTVRPAAAQATRAITNWSAVWAGAELFGTGGALLGMATGPGALVSSGVGALIGGYVGLVASEWVARRIELLN